MGVPEDGEDLFEAGLGGIEDDAGDFGVAGIAGANVVVGGVFGFAAHVAGGHRDDAGDLLEDGFVHQKQPAPRVMTSSPAGTGGTGAGMWDSFAVVDSGFVSLAMQPAPRRAETASVVIHRFIIPSVGREQRPILTTKPLQDPTPVAQTSKPAVSRVSKPAGLSPLRHPAD